MQIWRDITLVHRGEAVAIDGIGFSAIGRLELLQLLQQRAREAGVAGASAGRSRSLDELAGFDLIVAADGVNSLVRRAFEGDFGTSLSYLDEQVHLVRHHPALRYADADLRRDRARHLQRPPLPLRAGHEHLHRGVRPRHLAARRLRHGDRRGDAPAVRAGLRRDPRRSSAGLQPLVLAQLSLGLERALVVPQHGAGRRCAAHGALLHRLGHAAGAGGRAGAGQGAGGRARRPRRRRSRATRRSGGLSWRSWSRPRGARRCGTSNSPSTWRWRRSISP